VKRFLVTLGFFVLFAWPAFSDVVPGEAITKFSPKNLLADPGMERLTGNPANDAWSFYSADKFAADKAVAHDGKQSLRVDAKDKAKGYGAYSGTAASAGAVDAVDFGAWVRAEPALPEGAQVRIYAQIYLKGGKLIENTALLKGGGTDWRLAANRVPVGGAEVERTLLYCIAERYVGSVWFDDAFIGYVSAAGEPADAKPPVEVKPVAEAKPDDVKAAAPKPVQAGDGLLAHYTFEEGAGELLKDHSGNGNDGTIHGAAWVKTDAGGALSFKPGSYVDLGTKPKFNFPGDRAIAVWLKLASPGFPNPSTNWAILDGGDNYPTSGYLLRIDGDSGKVSFRHCAEAGKMRFAMSRRALDNNNYYFLVITRRGNSANLYIDAHADTQFDLLDSAPAKAPFTLSQADQSFYGLMDEVSLYQRALSAEEVIKLYQQGAARHGKDASWVGKIQLTTYPHYEYGSMAAVADFAGILPLQAGQQAALELGLPGQAPAVIQKIKTMPETGRCEYTFSIKELPAGAYQVAAVVRDAAGKAVHQTGAPVAIPYAPVTPASPAEKTVALLPAPAAPPAYQVELAAGGAFNLKVGGESYPVESAFSWPNGEFNLLGLSAAAEGVCEKEWKVTTRKVDDRTFQVTASGKFYKLDRTIRLLPTHVNVQDTLTNLTGEPIAVLFKNNLVTQGRNIVSACLAGAECRAAKTDAPLQGNPTLLLQKPGLGLGFVALDDVFIIQSKGDFGPDRSSIGSTQFALDKGASYTLEWSLYLNSTADYYDFINQIRADEGRNGKVEGGMALYYDRFLGRRGVPTQEYFTLRNIKYINFTSLDHPADDPQVTVDGIDFLRYPKEMERVKTQAAGIYKVCPDVKAMFHVAHSLYCTNKPEETFPDSRVITASGKQGIYYEGQEGAYLSDQRKKEGWHWYALYPTLDNSFGKELMRSADVMVDEMGCKGVFMDGFMTAYGGEYTYDRWDGHTAEIDPKSKTITRKVGSVLLLSQDALAAFSRKMRDKGAQVVANNSVITRTIGKETYIVWDKELVEDASTHLAPSVVTLSNAYNFTNEMEFYYDTLNKLKLGSLAFYYGDYPNDGKDFFTRPPMVSREFPITFQEIHSNYVKGQERLITAKPGVYGWAGDSELHCAHRYDAQGWEIPADFLTTVDEHGVRTEVTLNEKEAAVVEKVPVRLKSAAPVNVNFRRYDGKGMGLALHGKGKVEITAASGEFVIAPRTDYLVKTDKERKVTSDKKGVLTFTCKLDGPMEVAIAPVEK